ncbi:MAG: chloride channel protein [Candidatus Odinarchaeota archaeon]|nr:chloride channel protein [Candidatus Odinarchaeota archaeon]
MARPRHTKKVDTKITFHARIGTKVSQMIRSRVFRINALAIIVGLLSGTGVVIFHYTIDYFRMYFYEVPIMFANYLGPNGFYVGLPVMVGFGGLIVGVITFVLTKEKFKAHVAELTEAYYMHGGRLSKLTPIVKIITAAITLGSGGSAGPEAPAAVIGGSTGSALGQILKLDRRDISLLLLCGTSAGIGAAFRAPLGGTLFGLEVLLPEITAAALIPVILATVAAVIVVYLTLGPGPEFPLPSTLTYHPQEIILYFILGILMGFLSYGWIKFYENIGDIFKNLKLPKWAKPAIGGVLVAIIGFTYPQILGIGYNTIEDMFYAHYTSILFLLFLGFAKMLATSITLGSDGDGGIFTPTLFIGAVMGYAIGLIFQILIPWWNIQPQGYAVVGMGALLAGSTHTPLTIILIMLDMTQDYLFIIPLMTAVAVSFIISRSMTRANLYNLSMIKKGIILIGGHREDILSQIKIQHIMTPNVLTVKPDMRIFQVLELMEKTHHEGFPVVNNMNELIGIITNDDVFHAMHLHMEYATVAEFMKKDLVVTYPDETAEIAYAKLERHHIGRLPVVERDNPKKLVGIVTRRDVLRAYRIRFLIQRRLEKAKLAYI